jgi:hypothetical protein
VLTQPDICMCVCMYIYIYIYKYIYIYIYIYACTHICVMRCDMSLFAHMHVQSMKFYKAKSDSDGG